MICYFLLTHHDHLTKTQKSKRVLYFLNIRLLPQQ
ncbi:unnamed protein product [Amoebophrya sp. A25]|nr:unnamed protein product [Amoebophrya sp. A25]|eukprot:GSA25T00015580001.1